MTEYKADKQEKSATNETGSVTNPLDIFDNEAAFALPQNYATVGVKKVILRVPVKKPNKQAFFRVRTEPEYRCDVLLLEHGEERELYLVTNSASAEVSGIAQPYRLHVYITRQNALCLWPTRLEGIDGRTNAWWSSAREAAAQAMSGWIRIEPDMSAGSYVIYVPEDTSVLPDPEWPDLSMKDILRLAFKDRLIDSPDHIVLKKLRGAA